MTIVQSALQEVCETGVGIYGTPGDASVVMYANPAPAAPKKRAIIIALHGRGLPALTWGPLTSPTAYEHVRTLIQQGFVVASIDAAGYNAWSNAAEMTAITNAIAAARAQFPNAESKIGLLGFSMGGLASLNYIKRHGDIIAGAMLWSPCTDMQWAYGLSGYVPPYPSIPTQPVFQTEIDAAYATSPANFLADTAGYRIVDSFPYFAACCPLNIVHAADDSVVSLEQTESFIANLKALGNERVTFERLTTGDHGPWTSVDTSVAPTFFKNLVWS